MSRRHTGNIQPQLDLEEHNGDAAAKNVTIRGANAGGTQFNNAIVDDSGALKVTGGGGGGGGTVDQGVAGTDPWLVAIDQTGTNNQVEVVATVGLTDAELRATPVPVSGTVTVQDGGGAITVDGTVAVSSVGGTVTIQDGGNTITVDGTVGVSGTVTVSGTVDTELTTKDYDTGAGTETVAVVGIILPGSGGSVAGGTSTNPIRVDPTGTTTQPVSDAGGTLTVDQATAANLNATVVGTGTFAVQADTELETAAALADGQSNPTITRVGAVELKGKYVDGTLSFDRRPHSYYQNRTGVTTGSGAGTSVDMSMGPCSKFAMEISRASGTVTAYNITLEGSLDNSNWYQISNNTSATGADALTWATEKPVRYMRSNVTSITGGGTMRIRILASEA